MNIWDIVILLVIAGTAAVSWIRLRTKGKSGCAGCCAACGQACGHREKEHESRSWKQGLF